MKLFGLIGFPVEHSFSKKYFEEKFLELGLQDHAYQLFDMEDLRTFPDLWASHPDLKGLNVTVPHKQDVIQYLDKLDASAKQVGAVNVVSCQNGKLTGFNSDYLAFKTSLQNWTEGYTGNALILGTGGAAMAVAAGLTDLNISYKYVSRKAKESGYTYAQLMNSPGILEQFQLIINTTPLGMHPDIESLPAIPYEQLTEHNYLYDLVYNPLKTVFLKQGDQRKSKTKNGLEMLHLQAERSWQIWNDHLA